MSPAEYGIYDVCRSLAHKSGILFFSGRGIAARFKNVGRNSIYPRAASLTALGWLKVVKDSYRRADGTFSPRQYRVLSHDEWALEHPNECRATSAYTGLEDDAPGTAEELVNSQPGISEDTPGIVSDKPVTKRGHNLYNPTDVDPLKKVKPYGSQQENGDWCPVAGVDGFVQVFDKPRKGKKKAIQKSGDEEKEKATAPHRECEPARKLGLAEVEAEAVRLGAMIGGTIGLKHADALTAWNAGMKTLLEGGQAPKDIWAAADLVITKLGAPYVARQGAAGFVEHFPMLLQAAQNQPQQAAAS